MRTIYTLSQRYRASLLATVAGVLCLSCSNNNLPQEPPPPEPGQEFSFYMSDKNTVLEVCSAYSEKGTDPEAEPAPIFLITATLTNTTEVLKLLENRFIDPEIKGTDVTLRSITGIEVIANTDYDAEHPAGSSLNDILQIQYYDSQAGHNAFILLADYFDNHGSLEWNWNPDGSIGFFLWTTSPPLRNNLIYYDGSQSPYVKKDHELYGFGVTVYITMEGGQRLEIKPLPTQVT